MSKLENVENLVTYLCNLIQSDQYDIELDCINSEGDKIDGISQLACKSKSDAKRLAIMIILDTLEQIIIENYNRCEFTTVSNTSNKLVTIHGIRATLNLANGESVSRYWTYTNNRNLLPDDELDIAVARYDVSRQIVDGRNCSGMESRHMKSTDKKVQSE